MKHANSIDPNFNHTCPLNLKVQSKQDNLKLTNQLIKKSKTYLKHKYHSMIFDKQYCLDDFTSQIEKEINDFNYYNNPNQTDLFRIIESKFLKVLNKYDDKRRRILSPNKMREMTEQPTYQFNAIPNDHLRKKKIINLIEKNKNTIAKRRMNEIKQIEQRRCEEEISIKVEQKLLEAEKNYLKKVLTINKEGNEIKQMLDDKKQDCLIEALYN